MKENYRFFSDLLEKGSSNTDNIQYLEKGADLERQLNELIGEIPQIKAVAYTLKEHRLEFSLLLQEMTENYFSCLITGDRVPCEKKVDAMHIFLSCIRDLIALESYTTH